MSDQHSIEHEFAPLNKQLFILPGRFNNISMSFYIICIILKTYLIPRVNNLK